MSTDPYTPDPVVRERGNQYALSALRERRAFMTGELQKLENRRAYLKASLRHLDATIALMCPGHDPTLIKAKFPRRKSKLFGTGKLNQLILGAMRKADRPMSMHEITVAVVADAGMDAGDETTVTGMKSRVRSNLLYLTKVRGLLVKEGEGRGATWALAEAANPNC